MTESHKTPTTEAELRELMHQSHEKELAKLDANIATLKKSIDALEKQNEKLKSLLDTE